MENTKRGHINKVVKKFLLNNSCLSSVANGNILAKFMQESTLITKFRPGKMGAYILRSPENIVSVLCLECRLSNHALVVSGDWKKTFENHPITKNVILSMASCVFEWFGFTFPANCEPKP